MWLLKIFSRCGHCEKCENQKLIINLLNQIIMKQSEEAAAVNALTEKVKGIEVKIQALIDAAAGAGEVTPELQTAIDSLATEVDNADKEAGA